jgi:hypothetical protein
LAAKIRKDAGGKVTRKVDGENILYHYLEKGLQESDVFLFQMLAARLVSALGVWFSPTLYQQFPILLPFAIRDPNCRPRRRGDPDFWGAPNQKGYFRDDNSLIKSLPRTLPIESTDNPLYHGRRLGNGWVACHVWRQLNETENSAPVSTRDPDTYSFIPNLVWLPKQVAKLTDREGSFSQTFLQALSVKIYRSVPVSDSIRPIVERAWSKLPITPGIPTKGLPDVAGLSFFMETENFLISRAKASRTVAKALGAIAAGQVITKKVISSRYTEGIKNLSPDFAQSLNMELDNYISSIETGSVGGLQAC